MRIIGVIIVVVSLITGGILQFLGLLGSTTLANASGIGTGEYGMHGQEYNVQVRWEFAIPLAIAFVIGLFMISRRNRA
jgi:hypothetical protein